MLEFTSVAEMRAHYKAVRARVRFNKAPIPPPPEPEPEPVWEIVEPAIRAWVAPGVAAPKWTAPTLVEVEAPEPQRILISRIIHVVAQHFKCTEIDLISARRQKSVARPRQIAMYLAKTLTLKSLPEIGRRMGGRDHTTILHGVRKITGLLTVDPALGETIDQLTAELKV